MKEGEDVEIEKSSMPVWTSRCCCRKGSSASKRDDIVQPCTVGSRFSVQIVRRGARQKTSADQVSAESDSYRGKDCEGICALMAESRVEIGDKRSIMPNNDPSELRQGAA